MYFFWNVGRKLSLLVHALNVHEQEGIPVICNYDDYLFVDELVCCW